MVATLEPLESILEFSQHPSHHRNPEPSSLVSSPWLHSVKLRLIGIPVCPASRCWRMPRSPVGACTFKCPYKRFVRFACVSTVIANNSNQFGTLQFGRFEEIQKKGYSAAMDLLDKWEVEGRLPSAFIGDGNAPASGKTRGRSARRNSI